MDAAGTSRIRRIDTVRLDFSANVHWPVVEVALLHVLRVDVLELLGLEKLSPTRVMVSFATSHVYREFVARWNDRTLPLPASAVSVEISDPWGPLTFVSVNGVPVTFPETALMFLFMRFGLVVKHQFNTLSAGRLKGVRLGSHTLVMRLTSPIPSRVSYRGLSLRTFYQGQTRTCFRCGAEGHVVAGCDASHAEAPSVFLEDDFPCLSVRVDSPADPRSVQVPGVDPAAVPDVATYGPDMSAPPVSSEDLGAPVSDLRRSITAEVHPHPVALGDAVGVAPASSAGGCVLPGAGGTVVCLSPPTFSTLSPLAASSLPSTSPLLQLPSPSLVTSRVLESTLPPAVSLPSPTPVSVPGGGFLPRIVEAPVLRDRAAPALGPPADGSSGTPLAGG
ncbi:uncharacterized protein [Procambarus clarkii]|uniref:uncharacterized protein n=1 Tax=Procambarus clarkii TaxID=6728 RepID=UPI003742CA0A